MQVLSKIGVILKGTISPAGYVLDLGGEEDCVLLSRMKKRRNEKAEKEETHNNGSSIGGD